MRWSVSFIKATTMLHRGDLQSARRARLDEDLRPMPGPVPTALKPATAPAVGDAVISPRGNSLGTVEELQVDASARRAIFVIFAADNERFAVVKEALRPTGTDGRFVLEVDEDTLQSTDAAPLLLLKTARA